MHEAAERRQPPGQLEIAEETSRAVFVFVFFCVGTGIGHCLFRCGGEESDPFEREDAAQANDPVALVVFPLSGRDGSYQGRVCPSSRR